MSMPTSFESRDLATISGQLRQISDRLFWIQSFVAVLALIVAVTVVLLLVGLVSIEVTVDA